ncbi:GatB/YqeY domain-containing protein [Celerinatantimonas sp. MCCC 1A17872]|uniref:GatB/YqeY domain-containing protein n=1 Tax=Celerinatantimonas sp. MCCC 1A17872 TaxID=3177514 RepID=UPI0038C7AFDC
MSLKVQLQNAQKDALRAKDKARLSTLRMVMAEIKQLEVDERIEVSDDRIIAIITKMVKQRQDAAKQFHDAGREDLAEHELAEIPVLQEFLPQQLSDEEVAQLITQAIDKVGASGMGDMGKVMGVLKPQVQGRADMGAISGLVRSKLN